MPSKELIRRTGNLVSDVGYMIDELLNEIADLEKDKYQMQQEIDQLKEDLQDFKTK